MVKPKTDSLKGSNSNNNTPGLFINEEEVPRAGIIVTRTFQRTRYENGKTCVWLGRRKQTGKGEGSSGLSYDIAKEG